MVLFNTFRLFLNSIMRFVGVITGIARDSKLAVARFGLGTNSRPRATLSIAPLFDSHAKRTDALLVRSFLTLFVVRIF